MVARAGFAKVGRLQRSLNDSRGKIVFMILFSLRSDPMVDILIIIYITHTGQHNHSMYRMDLK